MIEKIAKISIEYNIQNFNYVYLEKIKKIITYEYKFALQGYLGYKNEHDLEILKSDNLSIYFFAEAKMNV